MTAIGLLVAYLIGIALLVAAIVFVLRWALRINDIVNQLDNIVELLRKT